MEEDRQTEKRYGTFTGLIASINRSIRRPKTEAMAEHGLKSPHVSCPYCLFKRPGMTAAEPGGLFFYPKRDWGGPSKC